MQGFLSQREFILQLTKQSLLKITDNKKRTWYNIPCAFDIETSSFYDHGEKRALMYIWMFGINDMVTYGRTWVELTKFLEVLEKVLALTPENRLVVYVHNLAYEWQFMRKHFNWSNTFFLEERKPVKVNVGGFEFRCSLKLSGGKSLEAVGEDLHPPVRKKVGDLDYLKLRTPLTPLTEKEFGYCEYDIRVLLAYIAEKIEQDGGINLIPLTNTGYVRNYCRKECFSRWKKYKEIMNELTIDPKEFSQLKAAFMGGFTHASAKYVQQVLSDVESQDFASSYPAVMLLEKFPMSRLKRINRTISAEELEWLLTHKACLFDVEFSGLYSKLNYDHPIPKSKCWLLAAPIIDNGRIEMAERLGTTVTEQDFLTYREFYKWDSMKISNFGYYEKQYLPHNFAKAILTLYEKKTMLKDVNGEELNYMILKNMLNAAFGMIVTNPVRDTISYNNASAEYSKTKPLLEDAVEQYNKATRRFLFYPWGVWVTAYARRNLFSGIKALGNDFVYSDTDSVKYLNPKDHEDYFAEYNDGVLKKIEAAAEFHRVPVSRFSPLNRKGVAKTIGVWDDEGMYDKFKTLGAKRYIVEKNDKVIVTLAGASKKKVAEYLVKSTKPFENFDTGMTIPSEYSGRLTSTYIDDETEGSVVDYTGVHYNYHELSSIHMEPSEYTMEMSDEFLNYLLGVKDYGY